MPIGSYKEATGEIGYGMTNDYMFRAVLQKNVKVLKGLICSLLHLSEEEVHTVQITNPIELGDDIDDKTFVLDIKVILNNSAIINLEMQMQNERNWEERSLSYLCRSFDQLYAGQEYVEAKPAMHIGFLNFTPFRDAPEFYATYQLLNVKNHRLYSDKFTLSVIDLTRIELATEEDKASQLDYWARFFTATSWEELKMIAEKNPNMTEATQTLYEMNADAITQEKCRARREYYRRQNTMNRDMECLRNEIDRMENEKELLMSENESLANENESLMNENESLVNENASLVNENASLKDEVQELKKKLNEIQMNNI